MAIYTRTGDSGSTSLFTGQRVSKTHLRVETYGTLDELNATLSLCYCATAIESHRILLEAIQQQIFGLALNSPVKANSRQRSCVTSVRKKLPRWKTRSIAQ